MKQAVAYLEPKVEKKSGAQKGTIVLATVKDDVHDIGKNLVDIILSNNGYRVVNLGIKQPADNIIKPPRNTAQMRSASAECWLNRALDEICVAGSCTGNTALSAFLGCECAKG